MNINKISFQLYTARKFTPYRNIFEYIHSTGIKNIELFALSDFDEIELKDLLQEFKLTSLSAHISFESLKDIDLILSKLKYLNIKHAIIPAPRAIPGKEFEDFFKISEEEWINFARDISNKVKVFNDNNFTLGYHNHSFEFIELPSGKMPIECMLDHNEDLKFEIDIGWATAAKADPIFWIKKYSKKIISCHLKDFFSQDDDLLNHNNQSSVGEGFIDWPKIFEELKKSNCELFILEHDDPKDLKDYTLKSLNYLKDLN